MSIPALHKPDSEGRGPAVPSESQEKACEILKAEQKRRENWEPWGEKERCPLPGHLDEASHQQKFQHNLQLKIFSFLNHKPEIV